MGECGGFMSRSVLKNANFTAMTQRTPRKQIVNNIHQSARHNPLLAHRSDRAVLEARARDEADTTDQAHAVFPKEEHDRH
jgi:hypothetical protein